jgi:hypothetical protein
MQGTRVANIDQEGQQPAGNEKSDVTETGQHIGSSADSTTVDGPKGSMSNN